MAEVVNLNRARKAKANAAAGRLAVANRVAFGRTKAEKEQAQRAARRSERAPESIKRER